MQIKELIERWVLTALGILIASFVFPGIGYRDVYSLVIAVMLLSACSIFVKPLLMQLALPFIVVSFGFGLWVINAVLFLLVAELVKGFYVDGFLNAMAGAFFISLTALVVQFGRLLRAQKAMINVHMQNQKQNQGFGQSRRKDVNTGKSSIEEDDVIDI